MSNETMSIFVNGANLIASLAVGGKGLNNMSEGVKSKLRGDLPLKEVSTEEVKPPK